MTAKKQELTPGEKRKRAAAKKPKLKKDGTPSRQGENQPKNKPGLFPKGNKWWQVRAKHGRDGIWTDPSKLAKDCLGYFEWLENNPMLASELVKYKGAARVKEVPRMRVATVGSLCLYLGITQETWIEYKKKDEFTEVCTRTEQAIREQKFSGAAAEMLNPSIIARDLGLADNLKNDHTSSDGSMSPKSVTKEVAEAVADKLLQK